MAWLAAAEEWARTDGNADNALALLHLRGAIERADAGDTALALVAVLSVLTGASDRALTEVENAGASPRALSVYILGCGTPRVAMLLASGWAWLARIAQASE